MKLPIMTKATEGWDFHFFATEEQARQILNARIGDRIVLTNDREFVVVHDDFMEHWMKQGEQTTYESLVIDDVKSKIREMLLQRNWEQE